MEGEAPRSRSVFSIIFLSKTRAYNEEASLHVVSGPQAAL